MNIITEHKGHVATYICPTQTTQKQKKIVPKDIQYLEIVQHTATKMIPSLHRMSYKDRLKAMELPSLVGFEVMLLNLSNIFVVFTMWTVLCCYHLISHLVTASNFTKETTGHL